MRLLSIFLLAALAFAAEQFPPNDVKIVGDVEYGKPSAPIECTSSQPYCAVLFNGNSGDKLQITVKGTSGKAFVALADGSLTELARGTDTVSYLLPKFADDFQTFYIVFRDAAKKDGRFTVTLTKAEGESSGK